MSDTAAGPRAILVHHADALSPAVDFERPLSSRGLRQAAWLAAEVKAAGFAIETIWHSGKRRARETGEAFLRGGYPSAQFVMVRGLRSEDGIDTMREELAAETRHVLLVGHMPNIARLLEGLSPSSAPMPLHGGVVLERDESGAWHEAWRAVPPE